jgi:N utilization substance protein B
MVSRNKIQELVVLALYQYLFYYTFDDRPSLKEIIENVFNCKASECDSFAKDLIKTAIKNADSSIKDISEYLNDWAFERLNYVEQAILLSAYTQYKYMEQPKNIAINVAVDLAKKYCDENSYKFINGVLDNCLC